MCLFFCVYKFGIYVYMSMNICVRSVCVYVSVCASVSVCVFEYFLGT